MIYDVFTYNGERDILHIHLNVLNDYVDKFIICEAKTTFTGHKKPLYFFRDQRYFRKFWPKIEYYTIPSIFTPEEIALAEQSPNTRGANHWKTEFLQKESIQKALILNHVQDEDTVFIGDVDEIWDTGANHRYGNKINLRVYAYYLNNESNEQFHGTYLNKYKNVKNQVLNHLRTNSRLTDTIGGWHFTSMGGLEEVQRKLNDSYTEESYNTREVRELLSQRIEEGTDYLGRNFNFQINEENWPQYLKDKKKQYKHLLWTKTN